MTDEVKRDYIGYGGNPPDPKWPNGARLAVNFVINYEEGSEPSVQDGEGYTENGHTESHGTTPIPKGRDLAAEGMFEYGSRVGFWRLHRLFQERGLPVTIFACALALGEALRTDRGGGTRTHRARRYQPGTHARPKAGWLVLPLRTLREYAPAGHRTWRLPV